MAGIFDYISRRGDFTFEQDGFNIFRLTVRYRPVCLMKLPLNRRQCVCLQPMITRKIYCGRVTPTF